MVSGDGFGWEREWPRYDEYLILDGSLDSRAQVDECPRCAAIVRTVSRAKHEAVCWGPEQAPVNPFLYESPNRLDIEYVVMLRNLLRSAGELGEHTLVDHESRDHNGAHTFRTTFYGNDFRITVQRGTTRG